MEPTNPPKLEQFGEFLDNQHQGDLLQANMEAAIEQGMEIPSIWDVLAFGSLAYLAYEMVVWWRR